MKRMLTMFSFMLTIAAMVVMLYRFAEYCTDTGTWYEMGKVK